jgi:hypothetical protein
MCDDGIDGVGIRSGAESHAEKVFPALATEELLVAEASIVKQSKDLLEATVNITLARCFNAMSGSSVHSLTNK